MTTFNLTTVEKDFKKDVVEEMVNRLGKDVIIVDVTEVITDESYLDLDPFDPQLDGQLEQLVTTNFVFKAIVKYTDTDTRVFEHSGVRMEGDVIIMVKIDVIDKIKKSNRFIIDDTPFVKHHIVPAGAPETNRYYIALKQVTQ